VGLGWRGVGGFSLNYSTSSGWRTTAGAAAGGAGDACARYGRPGGAACCAIATTGLRSAAILSSSPNAPPLEARRQCRPLGLALEAYFAEKNAQLSVTYDEIDNLLSNARR